MSNCDFGSPCDCKDCRTTHNTIICPSCEFENVVRILRNSKLVYEKGCADYSFSIPSGPSKDLSCFRCSSLIQNVGYYTEIDDRICERNLEIILAREAGRECSICKSIEGDFKALKNVVLHQRYDMLLCQDCLCIKVKVELPNPSTETLKYEFDNKELKWQPVRIKQACISCGQMRWLSYNNKWKKKCQKCFVKS